MNSYPEPLCVLHFEIDDLLDRGEKLMFEGDFSQALLLLDEALDLADRSTGADIHQCRGLFSRAIIQAAFGDEESALRDIDSLGQIIDSYQCVDAADIQKNASYRVYDKDILGEDALPIRDCLDRVDTTEKSCLLMIGCAPVSKKIKFSVSSAVTIVSDSARKCCRSGGVWKACLQPLLYKWTDLKMQWKEWEKICEPPVWH